MGDDAGMTARRRSARSRLPHDQLAQHHGVKLAEVCLVTSAVRNDRTLRHLGGRARGPSFGPGRGGGVRNDVCPLSAVTAKHPEVYTLFWASAWWFRGLPVAFVARNSQQYGPVQAAIIHLGPEILVFLSSVKLLRVRLRAQPWCRCRASPPPRCRTRPGTPITTRPEGHTVSAHVRLGPFTPRPAEVISAGARTVAPGFPRTRRIAYAASSRKPNMQTTIGPVGRS